MFGLSLKRPTSELQATSSKKPATDLQPGTSKAQPNEQKTNIDSFCISEDFAMGHIGLKKESKIEQKLCANLPQIETLFDKSNIF